jgi:hypothetical protein
MSSLSGQCIIAHGNQSITHFDRTVLRNGPDISRLTNSSRNDTCKMPSKVIQWNIIATSSTQQPQPKQLHRSANISLVLHELIRAIDSSFASEDLKVNMTAVIWSYSYRPKMTA